jgi:hypothetical protein
VSDADPVVVLVAEWRRLAAQCEAEIGPGDDSDEMDRIVVRFDRRIACVEDKIAGLVATSPAGINGQVRVLRALVCRSVEGCRGSCANNRLADRLLAAISAGVERIAGSVG